MVKAFRIAFPPRKAEVIDRFGVDPTEAEKPALQAILNYEKVWSSEGGGRYSNGAWPVLYTAAELQTAVVEKGYWVFNHYAKKVFRNKDFPHIQYVLELDGDSITLFDSNGLYDPKLVHPTDYTYCRLLALDALGKGVDYLVAPSARCVDGVCYPVLSGDLVTQLAVASPEAVKEAVFFWYYTEDKFSIRIDGHETEVVFDDVYAAKGGK